MIQRAMALAKLGFYYKVPFKIGYKAYKKHRLTYPTPYTLSVVTVVNKRKKFRNIQQQNESTKLLNNPSMKLPFDTGLHTTQKKSVP